jgi:hypothetical protein
MLVASLRSRWCIPQGFIENSDWLTVGTHESIDRIHYVPAPVLAYFPHCWIRGRDR